MPFSMPCSMPLFMRSFMRTLIFFHAFFMRFLMPHSRPGDPAPHKPQDARPRGGPKMRQTNHDQTTPPSIHTAPPLTTGELDCPTPTTTIPPDPTR